MTLVERVEPIHCVGESHCLRFRERLHHDAASGRWWHTRCHFLPRVGASNFTGHGGMHPDLAAALLTAGLCSKRPSEGGATALEPAHRATSFADRVFAARHAALADEPLVPPALLLFAGDIEVHSLAMMMSAGFDFELPGCVDDGAGKAMRRVPFEAVEATLRTHLQPFFAGLATLHGVGFRRTVVHGLLPRVGDDERVSLWFHGVLIPARLRTKLAMLANRLMAATCARLGLGFVDVWPALARGAHLDPRYELDGLHANAAATEATLPLVAAAFTALEPALRNETQYELLQELAVTRLVAQEDAEHRFASCGFSIHAPGATALAAIAPPVGDPAESATPRVLTDEEAAALAPMAIGWEHECGVLGIVPLRSHLPQDDRPAPAGTRMAWSAGRHALRVVVAERAGSAKQRVMDLAAGHCLVFDPARVVVRIADGTDPGDALQWHILPRLPSERPQAVRWSAPAWPNDPFWIPLAGDRPKILRRWREIEGRTVATIRSKPQPEPGEPVGAA